MRASLRFALVVVAAALAGCGSGDPCDGQAGACLTIDLQGKIAATEAMQIDLSMAVEHSFTKTMPPGVTTLPVQAGVLLPEVAGRVLVRAVALAGGKPVGLGMGAVDVAPGAHVRVAIVMAPAAGASCNDGFRDGMETDTDCGGGCGPCAVGQRCQVAADCGANLCGADKKCVAATCGDGTKNGKETDVDCGGGCDPCGAGRACNAGGDCKSGNCASGMCKAPMCDDGIKNGAEVDVDCGGSCGPCNAGKACAVGKDCLSGRCEMMKCVPLDLSFGAPTAYITGTGPIALVTGDWNGDKQPDVATLNQSSFTISVLLGKGGGQLQTATSYQVSFQPRALLQGDWNGDGKMDLLSLPVSNAPTLLAGKGDGTFTIMPAGVSVPASAVGGAAGDFDGDGKLDVAVFYAGQGVQFLQGQGNGTFQLTGNNLNVQGASAFAASDWNGDGRLDLAIGQVYNDVNGNPAYRVMFFVARNILQPGKFDFNQLSTIALPALPQAFAVGLLNADRLPDLIVGYGTSSIVSVALGDARNQNVPAGLATTTLPNGTRTLTTGDYNGDGKIDLVAASGLQNAWVVLAGKGDGTFAPADYAFMPAAPGPAAVVDLDGDNKAEVVGIVGAALAVHPSGGLQTITGYDPSNAQARAPALADLNGDRKLDLVLLGAKGLSISLGTGDGGFQAATAVATVAQPSVVLLRDVNGDGKIDAVVGSTTGNTIHVHLGNGDGTLQGALPFSAGNIPMGVAAGDLNGDGKIDLCTANANSNDVTVLWGGVMGALFGMNTTIALGQGSPAALTIADVSGDGNPDLVVALQSSNTVTVLQGNGKGSFAAPQNLVVGQRPVAVVAGDWNGDGRIDIATANQSNSASVLLGAPNGMFLAAVNYPVGVSPATIGAADFNLDGRLDLALGNAASGSVSVLLGDAQAGFAQAGAWLAGTQPSLAVGDLNNDGKADLVTASQGSGAVTVIFNQSL